VGGTAGGFEVAAARKLQEHPRLVAGGCVAQPVFFSRPMGTKVYLVDWVGAWLVENFEGWRVGDQNCAHVRIGLAKWA
jgi:hypothetical protein